MANYSIKIKKGDCEYSFSGNDKAFISSYIDKILGEINHKANLIESKPIPLLTAKKEELERRSVEIEKVKTISQPQFPTIRETKPLTTQEKSLADYSMLLQPTKIKEQIKMPEKLSQQDSEISGVLEFENILEDKIKNPVYEEQENKPKIDYETVIRTKNPESLIDYLVITAYYLLENENTKNFQLKQLNAKLYNSMKILVDRKTIQKAIEDKLLIIASNNIVENGAIEYALTQKGREYYINGYA